ncbi:MAG: flagellar biosynthetic protein FliR [Clostridiales bacterium]|nr:flagellar biosynthetic protein FliR [Clostridiales bacterium]
MLDATQMTGLACVFMRMTGCILFNPIFGRRNFPVMFQIGFTLALTVMVFTYSDVSVALSGSVFIETFIIFAKELFVGFAMGTVVSLFVYVVLLGGEFIDLQMGLSMSRLYDPQSGVQMSVNATFFNLMFVFMFFGLNGHLTLIHMFINSAELIPYGQVLFSNPAVSSKILDTFCQCTTLGIKMAMPILGMEFLLEMGVGILMKTIPQINVFVVNLQVKILTGLVMLAAIFTPLSNFIEQAIGSLFKTMGEVMLLIGS